MNLKAQEAILKTLAYHDVFAYPLKESELQHLLISSTRLSEKALHQQLLDLVAKGTVGQRDDFFFLKGCAYTVLLREAKEALTLRRQKRAHLVAFLARLVPWIKMVALTGKTAVGGCEKADDIDWLIVTSPKRLWLSRLFLVTLLRLTGQYRTPKKYAGKICPNTWLTAASLKIAKETRDVYLAHEIAQMVLLWDREGTYRRFLQDNGWVRLFLPYAFREAPLTSSSTRRDHLLFPWLMNYLDTLAGRLQRLWMKRHLTTETVSDALLKFHTRDSRTWILPQFESRLRLLKEQGLLDPTPSPATLVDFFEK